MSETKPKINFLQECSFEKREKKLDLQIRQRKMINSDKENNRYIKKMGEVRAEEAALKASLNNNTLEMFNYDLKDVELSYFFDKFDSSKAFLFEENRKFCLIVLCP